MLVLMWQLICRYFLGTEYEQRIRLRALLLNCLTSEYAELWEREFSEDFQIGGQKMILGLVDVHFLSFLPSGNGLLLSEVIIHDAKRSLNLMF